MGRERTHNLGITIICACGCDNEFNSTDSRGRKRIFIHGHNKGHNNIGHTPEAILKMSKAASGKKYSIESRIKRGIHHKGDKNVNWKGGVTSINETIRKSIEYKIWRKTVFERDNYTCLICGEKEKVSGHLEADHIKPFAYFPEERFNVNNGRTLCNACHKNTDTYLVKAKKKYKGIADKFMSP